MKKIKEILQERQKTHGDFSTNSKVSQDLQAAIFSQKAELTDVQREALQMFCHKIGRIVSGNPNEPDHWADIAGYAQLVVDRM